MHQQTMTSNRQRNGLRRPLWLVAALATMSSSTTTTTTEAFSALPQLRRQATRRVVARSILHAGGAEPMMEDTHSEFLTTKPHQMTEQEQPLKMVVDERREFEVNVGKAVDTLRKDYPDILEKNPDYSIYHPKLEVVDPKGFTLHGIQNYKTAFRFVHAIVNLFYCPERSTLQFRLIYDCARNHIRVSWNAVLVPREIFGGKKTMLHVDGISVYEVDRTSGLIDRHRVEHLLINDAPVRARRGIFYALTNEIIDPENIPVLGVDGGGSSSIMMEFKDFDQSPERSSSSLFSMSTSSPGGTTRTTEGGKVIDWETFERKNASRKKFGLKPLTPEEFEEVQVQVEHLEEQQKQKAAAAAAAELSREKKEAGAGNFFTNMLGNVLEDTCESNFDCERPQVCCDFKFKKMCCASGAFVIDGTQQRDPATVRVPIPGPEYPGMGDQYY